MDEKLRQIHNSVQPEVVLGTKQWQSLPWVQRGVKGHREDFVADKPTSVLISLISIS